MEITEPDMDGMGIQTMQVKKIKPISAIERQESRQRGETYITRDGKTVADRQFEFFKCKCRFDCHTLNENSRQKLFDDFWALGSWNSQTVFLRSCMIYVSNQLI